MTVDSIYYGQPFYFWDTIPYVHQQPPVNVGISLDSIFPATNALPGQRPSLFNPLALQPQHTDLIVRYQDHVPAWVFLILISLCALTYLYYNIRKIRLRDMPSILFDHRAMDRIVRENNIIPQRLAPIGALWSATLSLPILYLFEQNTSFATWTTLMLGLTAFYILRWGLLRIIGNVYYCREAIGAYITTSYFHHLAYITVTLPLLFLLIYMPWGKTELTYIIGWITVLEFLVRIIQGVKVFLTFAKKPEFFLFYYLCTVEIIPVIVVTGWVLSL